MVLLYVVPIVKLSLVQIALHTYPMLSSIPVLSVILIWDMTVRKLVKQYPGF